MRITVLCQYAKGVAQHDEAVGTQLLHDLARIKWLLWHGNTHRVRETIEGFLDDAEGLKTDYPNLRRFVVAAQEFWTYIGASKASLINYGVRYRAGERISSAFVEATVNAAVSKRFAKNSRCSGARAGRTCSCRHEREPSTARCVLPSSAGIQDWPTTMPTKPARRPDRPTNAYAPLR